MSSESISSVDAEEQALVAAGTDVDAPIDEAEHKQLAFSFAKRHKVLLETAESPALLYHTDETDFAIFAEVRRFLGQPFQLREIEGGQFEKLLTSAFQRDSSAAKQLMEDIGNESDLFALAEELPDTEDLLESEDDAPIIKLINAMLGEAIKEGASDIHIETFETQLLVRFRVDGVLREILRPNRKMASMLVSRIKVMSKMDIAEKRVPQDGRITLRIAGRAVDVRVSTMPSSHGERVVLRLLDKNNVRMNLQDLGMTKANRGHFSELIRKPHGIILVTGPTGSGKSTTLYAGLSEINSKDRNILTVEDPIEFDLLGIEPFLLSSSLLAVLSQRLVRTLCPECKISYQPSAQECTILGIAIGSESEHQVCRPKGCAACNHTGYRGRTGIHELLIVDEGIRELIHNGHGEQAIEKYIRQNTPSIRDDGCRRVLRGITSLEEVLRVTRED